MVELTDSLVEDFDVVDLLTVLSDRCVEVLDVAAAGVMLAPPGGYLRVMASSSVPMRVLELFEEQYEEGPCPDCYRTGLPVVNQKLSLDDGRWPRFSPLAVDAGFRSAHALPMHLHDLTIGALNLFRADEGELTRDDVVAAQALADMATIAILLNRVAVRAPGVNGQLDHALNDRIRIEQAKGVVAEQSGLDLDQAFEWLRIESAVQDRLLSDVAQSVIDRTTRATPDTP
jgi:hypothetical protein